MSVGAQDVGTCKSWEVGNNTFASDIVLCLESVTEDEVTYSVENRPLRGGGFFLDPRMEIRRDGQRQTVDHILDTGDKVIETVSITGDGVTVAIKGDWPAPCWCIGPRTLSPDCSAEIGADCLAVEGLGGAGATRRKLAVLGLLGVGAAGAFWAARNYEPLT